MFFLFKKILHFFKININILKLLKNTKKIYFKAKKYSNFDKKNRLRHNPKKI